MLDRDRLTKEAAEFKNDAKKRFDAALAALLALAWKHKDLGGDFTFDADPEMYAEALRICRDMSDGTMADAERHIRALFEDNDDFEIDNFSADNALESLDMAGTHLIQLVEVWCAVAFSNGFSQAYTRISIGRYLRNPYASGMFGAWGKDVLKWGRGYDRNIINQMAVIGQNLIVDAARAEEWREEREEGATYYVRRRGSGYDCPDCDAITGVPIPIDVPFERLHSRCMCYPEYHFDEMPTP